MPLRVVSKSAIMFQADQSSERIQLFTFVLRSWRKDSGLTQMELCELAGITQPQYSAIENGHYEPVPDLVFKIEKVLGWKPGGLSQYLGYLPVKENNNAR